MGLDHAIAANPQTELTDQYKDGSELENELENRLSGQVKTGHVWSLENRP
jgi:hypothetical protein